MTELQTKESEINEAIAALKVEYDSAVENLPAAKVAVISDKIKAKREELCKVLSTGAKPCPVTGWTPIGMLKRKSFTDKNGDNPPIYEVGTEWKRATARGSTPEQAIKKWNDPELWEKPIAESEVIVLRDAYKAECEAAKCELSASQSAVLSAAK